MSESSWPWSTVAAVGDGTTTLSEALSREFLSLYFGVQDPTLEGVSKGVLNELAVSGTASPISIATGSAICYGLYRNTAVVTKAIATPAVGTTGFRVVLQTNWAGVGGAAQASTRIAVDVSADGVAAIPALTQVALTTWQISLATGTITTGGVITLTDARNFRKSTAVVNTGELVALAVTTAKIALLNITTALINDLAVTTGKIADLAVTSGKLAALSVVAGKIADGAVDTAARLAANVVTTAKILDANVTSAKLRDSNPLSVIGRDANSTGVPADIVATVDGTVLRRSGNNIAFLTVPTAGIADDAVTTAKLAADSVDDTKAGNRVLRLDSRQGGSASSWDTVGNSNFTPTMVRCQVGVKQGDADGDTTVTFPTAFSDTPVVFVTVEEANSLKHYFAQLWDTNAATFSVRIYDDAGALQQAIFHWGAFGPG